MDDTFGPNPFETTQTQGAHSENKAEGVVPVLIKQIHGAPEGNYQMFGRSFGMVTHVGLIRNIEMSSTKITYLLEDHTGQIEAHYWLEEGESAKAPDVMVNSYAKSYGSLRVQGGKKTIILFKMLPVITANEITTFLLEVLNARYKTEEFNQQKTLGVERMDFETSAVGGFSVAGQSTGNTHGLEGKQLVVFEAIKNCRDTEVGISLTELRKKFSHITPSELQGITDAMALEGHIYSSIDHEHFLCTDP